MFIRVNIYVAVLKTESMLLFSNGHFASGLEACLLLLTTASPGPTRVWHSVGAP